MELFNNIIVPLDGSESSAHALPAARLMAGASGAKLTLVRCFPDIPDWQADASRGRRRGSLALAEHDRIDAYLSGERLRLQRQGFIPPVEIEAREGPAHEIIAGIANQDPDSLITMSTQGQGGLARLLGGSVASRVIGSVNNPAFVVRCNELDCPALPQSFSNVIVPLDGSESGESALRYAGALASAFSARITLVRSIPDAANIYAHADWSCVYGGPSFAYYDCVRMGEDAEALTNEYLSQKADDLSHRFPGADIEAVATRQNPVRSILDAADNLDNPMVVMATHGRRGLRRLLFGSVADQVIRNSQVPTLLVKRGDGDVMSEQ